MQVAKQKRKIMQKLARKIIMILALVPSIAFGNLIDLTPGGFHESDLPPVFVSFVSRVNRDILFFDSIYASPTNGFPAGWVSHFGVLNGGVYFFSHIDLSGPVPTTTISWDFGDSGFYLTNVLAEAAVPGNDLAHLYGLGRDRFLGEGTVILDGIVDMNSIAFYGRNINMVPDSGTTLGLFMIGLLGLFYARIKR
jgi:hypothetical protein